MSKKLPSFSGTKKCMDGELYRFKKGVAVVPGFTSVVNR